MSHELRTPLNAIIGVTEMLQEDARDLKREDEVEPLDRVLRAARHLLALINDILDLSKIESGKMDLSTEFFAVAPLIDEVVKTLETLSTKNGNRVIVDCSPKVGTIHADQMRLRQALVEPCQQCQQVHRARHGDDRGRSQAGGRPRVDRDFGVGHRHRHDSRADRQAVPGILPGRRLDHAQIRRHRSRARHQPAVLPDDGRRHHRHKASRAAVRLSPSVCRWLRRRSSLRRRR